MIDRTTIDKIKDTARIEDVVGQYVTLHRRGANLTGLCPFHDEKTPSFNVNPARNIFKCFGCSKAGNPISFVMEIEKCSYPDALRKVAKMYHIEVQETEQTEEERKKATERDTLFRINDAARKWYENQLWETQEGQSIGVSYLMSKRGIREDIIRKFQIGYSPVRSSLPQELIKNYPEELIKKLRLCGEGHKTVIKDNGEEEERSWWYDTFNGRVIFPWFTVSGQIIAFNGRRLDGVKEKKYVNSMEVEGFFSKSEVLYGIFQAKTAIAKQNFCYIVEGQMDVISMFQAGIENVVASSGTALTEKQVRLIKRFTNNVVVLYDGDSAGQKASNRGMDMFFQAGMNVKVLLLPEEEDPDSLSHKMSSTDFAEYLKNHQTDFIQYKINQLTAQGEISPDLLKNLIHDIAHTISLMPDAIDRQVYIQTTSSKLQIPENILSQEIAKIINDNKQKAQQKVENSLRQEGDIKETDNSIENKSSVEHIILPSTQLEQKLQENERNIAMVLVRFGRENLFFREDGSPIAVDQYIFSELSEDNIHFSTAAYEQLVEEYKKHIDEPGFNPEKYFTTCDDTNLLEIGCDLAALKYQLPNVDEKESLSESVPKMILELKLSLVEIQLFKLKQQIKNLQGDSIIPLLKQQQELDYIRRSICKIIR